MQEIVASIRVNGVMAVSYTHLTEPVEQWQMRVIYSVLGQMAYDYFLLGTL